MTPDHETDTLEGLEKRWREIAAKPSIPAHDRPGQIGNIAFQIGQEVYTKCADELAPILAGLRELREQMQNAENYRTKSYIAGSAVVAESMKHFIGVFDKWLGQPATADQTAYGLSKSQDKRLKALGKPADQTGAGKGDETK